MLRNKLVTEPFEFQIENVGIQGDYHIHMDVWVSSVSKIACVVNETNSSPQDIHYIENKETRYYIRTKSKTSVAFRINYIPGVEQRLFCKFSGLLYEPYHVEYYQSAPFNITCIFQIVVIFTNR